MKRVNHSVLRTLLLLLWGLLCTPAEALLNELDYWNPDYNVQSMIGGVRYHQLKFTVSDSQTERTSDLSSLPQIGGAWMTSPIGERLQFGLESFLLVGFRADHLNYLQAGGSGLYVDLSISLWTFDLAGGVYASLYLDPNRNVRLYAGAGPAMLYASYRSEREYSDGTDADVSSSAFGMGAYVRAGLEFRIQEFGMVGLGVRESWTDADFSSIGGSTELSGTAFFASFTAGF